MLSTRALSLAAHALPFLLGIYIVTLHASVGRPIWIDEFSHFAFAAEPSTRDAWALFLSTADNVQHGQTGIYIILNYWTLNAFGLDATLLRLPSILSGLFLFASAAVLFRVLGFGLLWQVAVVGALTGQHLLMHFVGEARAYAPIPAAAVGLLLFYIARPLYPYSRALLAFGIFAAVFGATMHAYFSLYWPAVCLVAYVHHHATTGTRFTVRALVAFANPGLVALGSGLYLLLAAFTWLRGHPRFDLDPFEWMQRHHGTVANFTNYSHTQFLDGSYAVAAIFTAAVVCGAMLLPTQPDGRLRGLRAPALLILLSVAISLLLAWISYLSDYWILARQWVGSVALLAVGMVWFWAEAARVWSRLTPLLGGTIGATALLLVSAQAVNIHGVRLAEWRARTAEARADLASHDCEPPSLDTRSMTNDERNAAMVELANRNIRCGGPIWPVFRDYYAQPQRG